MSVLFVTPNQPGPLIGGGPRRTYQLLYELGEYYGADQVELISSDTLFPQSREPKRRLLDFMSWMLRRTQDTLTNPYKLLLQNQHAMMHPAPLILRNYRQTLEVKQPDLCVLEHPGLGALAEINASLGVRTIMAPWNFESLTGDISRLANAFRAIKERNTSVFRRVQVRSVFVDFANEMLVYSKAVRNWFLSRTESGFAEAAGLSAGYLPYYPIGQALDALLRIRKRRIEGNINPRLFLISGGGNAQNSFALEGFLLRLRRMTLPHRIDIAIAGTPWKPKNLTAELEDHIRFLGPLSLDKFEALLTQCSAVLVPQECGFGCLTRVPDMLCAGIPVIADQLVMNATDKLPGVNYVDGEAGWEAALDGAIYQAGSSSSVDFDEWLASMRSITLAELERTASPARHHATRDFPLSLTSSKPNGD